MLSLLLINTTGATLSYKTNPLNSSTLRVLRTFLIYPLLKTKTPFSSTGEWVHEKTYIDRIVSRVMFRAEKNPATGLEDQRMDREYLVVLKRK